ncbi:MAG: hypothetical protein J4428_01050 [Candidatus Aenigmarchaeota archaeon]|nr:hypothetical protein [Candidatus Aenigmarchaeota archaeon]
MKLRGRINKKLKKYVEELNRFVFSYKIPAAKLRSEIAEHFSFIRWVFKRIFLPIALFYIIVGLIFKVWIVDSLFLGFFVFIYSNFLPDIDSVFKINAKKDNWYERYLLLFFAPIILFYLFSENSKHLYSSKPKPFHNLSSVVAYGTFLLILGFLFYRNWLEMISLPVFGIVGYLTHLSVDKYI